MSNILLDLGTHNTEGLCDIIKELNVQPNDESWIIHTFEPNPILDTENRIKQLVGYNITLHKKAVWIKDGNVRFKRAGKDGKSQGGYVEEIGSDRQYSDHYDEIEIECINFIDFIKQFNDEDDIYIKMDIEFAEYNVLEAMIESGWRKNIKILWVEWHGTNFDDFKDKPQNIKDKLKDEQVIIKDWR